MSNKHILIPLYVFYASYKDRFKQAKAQFYILPAVFVYAK